MRRGRTAHQCSREVVDVEWARPVGHRPGVQGRVGDRQARRRGRGIGRTDGVADDRGRGLAVYAVGNDPDRATARTVGSGQALVQQWLDRSSGDTFWVQALSAPTGAAGSNVKINDTAPVTDRWNFSAVEVRRKAP